VKNTSWSPVAKWYSGIVGEGGHYFHEHVIFSSLKKILNPKDHKSVLDIGLWARSLRTLSPGVTYTGIDISKDLLTEAKKLDKNSQHSYYVADAARGIPTPADSFDHAVCILAIQNMQDAALTIANIALSLKPGGDLVIVMNHPCFRIPRQSSWEIDEANKLEYRRVGQSLPLAP